MGFAPNKKLGLRRCLLQERSDPQLGFSLVEVTIVAGILGVLSALALPNLSTARVSSEAGARVGEAIGLARECASYVASEGVGTQPTTTPGENGTIRCTSTGGTVVSGRWPPGTAGVRCLGVTSTTSSTQGTITITSSGSMQCVFGTTE